MSIDIYYYFATNGYVYTLKQSNIDINGRNICDRIFDKVKISQQNIIFPLGNKNIFMEIISVESINSKELKHKSLCNTIDSISNIKLYSNKNQAINKSLEKNSKNTDIIIELDKLLIEKIGGYSGIHNISSKNLQYEFYHINGNKEGKYIYSGNKIYAEIDFVNNMIHGNYIQYFAINRTDNNLINVYESYCNNKKEGVCKYYRYLDYYKKNVLTKEITYKNNEKNGLVKIYNKKGKLNRMYNHMNGKLNGIYEFYKHQLLWKKYIYVDGKLNGLCEIYDISKDRKSSYIANTINYINNKKKEYTEYDIYGSIIEHGMYNTIKKTRKQEHKKRIKQKII
jgi:hypothetical protein